MIFLDIWCNLSHLFRGEYFTSILFFPSPRIIHIFLKPKSFFPTIFLLFVLYLTFLPLFLFFALPLSSFFLNIHIFYAIFHFFLFWPFFPFSLFPLLFLHSLFSLAPYSIFFLWLSFPPLLWKNVKCLPLNHGLLFCTASWLQFFENRTISVLYYI